MSVTADGFISRLTDKLRTKTGNLPKLTFCLGEGDVTCLYTISSAINTYILGAGPKEPARQIVINLSFRVSEIVDKDVFRDMTGLEHNMWRYTVSILRNASGANATALDMERLLYKMASYFVSGKGFHYVVGGILYVAPGIEKAGGYRLIIRPAANADNGNGTTG